MRIRPPEWDYRSHGPYLVTRQRPDGSSETLPADDLRSALHRALHWHTTVPDHEVVVVDGWGEFVFSRAARAVPADESHDIGTQECYELLMRSFPQDDGLVAGATSLFAGIDPD